MTITTSNNNEYSYLCKTNEIVNGVVIEQAFLWEFAPLEKFTSMPNVDTFIISLTEVCNLRCIYCCYSGKYKNNHTHSTFTMNQSAMDDVLLFIQTYRKKNSNVSIAFYGGEPLTQYDLIRYAVEKAVALFGESTEFSVSTNGILLMTDRIEWLVAHNVRIDISLDGTEEVQDLQRVDANGNGSFRQVFKAIEYIHDNHPIYLQEHVFILMTLVSLDNLASIAESWSFNPILKNLSPVKISSLSINPDEDIREADYEILRKKYLHLLNIYEQHQEWVVLKTFFNQCVAYWRNRPIVEADGAIPMATCLPQNKKLYIDSHLEVGVCEKMSDKYRIGKVRGGIDWRQSNELIRSYYHQRKNRCLNCPAIRMCDMCLTTVEFNDEQWNTLCHNERVYHKLFFWLFCEMAERGMITNDTPFPVITTFTLTLNEITVADIPALREIFNDKETRRYLLDLCHLTRDDDGIHTFLNSFKEYQNESTGILWGIRKDNTVIGFIGIMDIPDYPAIFYAMHPKYRGQGYMKESVHEAVEWFDKNYPNLKLHTEVNKDNAASLHILNQVGSVSI